ncbi:MAG: 50S ribosomal protein L11 methyltransferase [Candidatus Aenigmarchaeota archaeon]|nr:50S ribosomal protein L11 methyltransferase [Candidatus Aenigmarchaeota archaeon]MDW8149584.1 50S ribosomal protein L11 methyltransferase [Candidatus Aenigmarchaeota archaeon]
MINEARLAILLSLVKEHPFPNYFLQQYMIPPAIAARILSIARKDIIGKIVFDLGCGTGRFTIGSALIGAKLAKGFDIDKYVLNLALESAKIIESRVGILITNVCKFELRNVLEIEEKCDTVIQFPPLDYGMEFFKKAVEISNVVYSVHQNSRKILEKLESIDKIEVIENFNYPLVSEENGIVNRGIILIKWKK